jgi:nitrile hydratase accessory protein
VDGKPAFEEPWQAEALAIADTLVRCGIFTASAWSETLGSALAAAAAGGETDDQETYYRCVLEALEQLVAINTAIDQKAMADKRGEWEHAYLATPHGKPVILGPGA